MPTNNTGAWGTPLQLVSKGGQSIVTTAFSSQTGTQFSMDARVRRLEVGEIRLRRGSVQPTSGSFTRGGAGNLDGSAMGNINLTSSDVLKLGSIPPSVCDGFSITVTDTTAVIYWDGTHGSNQIKIRRIDGSVFVIPPNSMTITGLAATTTYYMLPFWTPATEAGTCGNVGWVAGDSGLPMFCMLNVSTDQLAQQVQEGREPLSHPTVVFATSSGAATQSTSGGGSSAAGGSSVDSSGHIRPNVL